MAAFTTANVEIILTSQNHDMKSCSFSVDCLLALNLNFVNALGSKIWFSYHSTVTLS